MCSLTFFLLEGFLQSTAAGVTITFIKRYTINKRPIDLIKQSIQSENQQAFNELFTIVLKNDIPIKEKLMGRHINY